MAARVLRDWTRQTRLWIDESWIEITMPNHALERTAVRRLDLDVAGFMDMIGQSVSAPTTAVAQLCR